MPTQIGIVIGGNIASPYGLQSPKPSPPQSSPPKSKK